MAIEGVFQLHGIAIVEHELIGIDGNRVGNIIAFDRALFFDDRIAVLELDFSCRVIPNSPVLDERRAAILNRLRSQCLRIGYEVVRHLVCAIVYIVFVFGQIVHLDRDAAFDGREHGVFSWIGAASIQVCTIGIPNPPVIRDAGTAGFRKACHPKEVRVEVVIEFSTISRDILKDHGVLESLVRNPIQRHIGSAFILLLDSLLVNHDRLRCYYVLIPHRVGVSGGILIALGDKVKPVSVVQRLDLKVNGP